MFIKLLSKVYNLFNFISLGTVYRDCERKNLFFEANLWLLNVKEPRDTLNIQIYSVWILGTRVAIFLPKIIFRIKIGTVFQTWIYFLYDDGSCSTCCDVHDWRKLVENVLTRWQQYFIRIECNLTYVNVYPFQSGLDNEKIAWLHSCRLILYLQLILYWNIVFRVIWNQFTDLINRVRNWIHKIVYIYIFVFYHYLTKAKFQWK